jgi:hypothetical protein
LPAPAERPETASHGSSGNGQIEAESLNRAEILVIGDLLVVNYQAPMTEMVRSRTQTARKVPLCPEKLQRSEQWLHTALFRRALELGSD